MKGSKGGDRQFANESPLLRQAGRVAENRWDKEVRLHRHPDKGKATVRWRHKATGLLGEDQDLLVGGGAAEGCRGDQVKNRGFHRDSLRI